jgi:hypothetical protein
MASSEVQRTLVKSPPELWAELSDPVSLARHLGHFGEIRIARIEPETTVEWETDSVAGAVHLKPSGWGTKVTLSITRKDSGPEVEATQEPEAAPEPDPEPEAAVEPDPPTEAAVEPDPEPEAATETDPEPEATAAPASKPLSRFFTRLFWRRRKAKPEFEPAQPQAEGPQPEWAQAERLQPVSAQAEQPQTEQPIAEQPPAEQAIPEPTDLAAELAEIEATLAEQDATLLSDVLDRLGAAHHRPFSRG